MGGLVGGGGGAGGGPAAIVDAVGDDDVECGPRRPTRSCRRTRPRRACDGGGGGGSGRELEGREDGALALVPRRGLRKPVLSTACPPTPTADTARRQPPRPPLPLYDSIFFSHKIHSFPTKCILFPDPPFFSQTHLTLFHKFSPRAFFSMKRLQLFGQNPDIPTAPSRSPPPQYPPPGPTRAAAIPPPPPPSLPLSPSLSLPLSLYFQAQHSDPGK